MTPGQNMRIKKTFLARKPSVVKNTLLDFYVVKGEFSFYYVG